MKRSQEGFTLIELAVVMAILGILAAIAIPTFMRIIGNARVNAAIIELNLTRRISRYDVMGEGKTPRTLCATNRDGSGIKYLTIKGRDCDEVTTWKEIRSVQIDLENSTLRSMKGIAGNSDEENRIYRLSYADTKGGYGGSYGQLGKLVVSHPWTDRRKCIVLSKVDGFTDIREGKACLRRRKK